MSGCSNGRIFPRIKARNAKMFELLDSSKPRSRDLVIAMRTAALFTLRRDGQVSELQMLAVIGDSGRGVGSATVLGSI